MHKKHKSTSDCMRMRPTVAEIAKKNVYDLVH